MKKYIQHIAHNIFIIKFFIFFSIYLFTQNSFAFQDSVHKSINEQVSIIYSLPNSKFNLEYFFNKNWVFIMASTNH